MRKYKLFIISILLIFPLIGIANQYESVDDLKTLVTHYLDEKITTFQGERTEINVGHIDTRLHLPKCDKKIKPFLPRSNYNNQVSSVGLSCKGNKAWTIYVPTQIKIFSKVAVARRHLARGQIINRDDIEIVEKNRARLRNGYYQTVTPLIGMVAKRGIPAGKAITQRAITPQAIIHRGQAVIISARTGSVQVEMKGIAQSSGKLNHRIKVLNKSSKRVVEAIVTGPGHVEAPM